MNNLRINNQTYLQNKDKITSNTFINWDSKEQKYIKTDENCYFITKVHYKNKIIITFLKEVLNQWHNTDSDINTYKKIALMSLMKISSLNRNDYLFVYHKEHINNKKIENIFGIALAERINNQTAELFTNITYPNAQLEPKDRPNGTIGAAGSNLRHHMITYLFEELKINSIKTTVISKKALKGLLEIGFEKYEEEK